MGGNIFVGNLSFSVGEERLWELFGQKGTVDSVTVMCDPGTGRSRGFAFCQYGNRGRGQKRHKGVEWLFDG
jgi:RNA recognition motif-containing protein